SGPAPLAIDQRPAIRRGCAAASGPKHGIAGGGVPFHGSPETGVKVRLPARQEAEFKRRADGYQFGCLQRGAIGLRPGSVVGTADHHAQRIRGRADPYWTAAGNTKLIVNSKPLGQAGPAREEMSA